MKKTCTGCGESKSLEEFSRKKESKDGRHSRCKVCTRNYTRTHYRNNKRYYGKKARAADARHRDWFLELKAGLKCIRCPESDPVCLDFHHRDTSTKSFELGHFRKHTKSEVLAEVAKCDVLCANCHRKEHRDLLRGVKCDRRDSNPRHAA